MISALPQPIKKGIRTILSHRSLRPFIRRYAGLGSIMLYHRVTTQLMTPSEYHANIGLFVHVDQFEEQIKYVRDHYRVLDIGTATERLAAGTLEPDTVVVTFDDGYLDNLTYALPVLEKYGVPATIYVTTGYLEGSAKLWWYEIEHVIRSSEHIRLEWRGTVCEGPARTVYEKYAMTKKLFRIMKKLNLEDQAEVLSILGRDVPPFSYEGEFLSWEQVKQLREHPLVTIGGHTLDHPVLSRLTREAALREMLTCKSLLEERTGGVIDHFAYPFGGIDAVSPREHLLAKQAGFRSAVTTRFGHLHSEHRNHLFAIPRITVDYFDTLPTIISKLSGMESMIEHRGKRFVGI